MEEQNERLRKYISELFLSDIINIDEAVDLLKRWDNMVASETNKEDSLFNKYYEEQHLDFYIPVNDDLPF